MAGSKRIFFAAMIAFSVRPYGSPWTTLMTLICPSALKTTLRTTVPSTLLSRASRVYWAFSLYKIVGRNELVIWWIVPSSSFGLTIPPGTPPLFGGGGGGGGGPGIPPGTPPGAPPGTPSFGLIAIILILASPSLSILASEDHPQSFSKSNLTPTILTLKS